jgi:hypothetical protein
MSREPRARPFAPRRPGSVTPAGRRRHGDDWRRRAGSLPRGWGTASLFLSTLQASPRQPSLARALPADGRLVKPLFSLRSVASQASRRRTHAQRHTGESWPARRAFLFVADKGVLRRPQAAAPTHQARGLTLITNAVVVWHPVSRHAVLDRRGPEGFPVHEAALAPLAPARCEPVHPSGTSRCPLEHAAPRHGLRPLRAA